MSTAELFVDHLASFCQINSETEALRAEVVAKRNVEAFSTGELTEYGTSIMNKMMGAVELLKSVEQTFDASTGVQREAWGWLLQQLADYLADDLDVEPVNVDFVSARAMVAEKWWPEVATAQ